MNKKRRVKIKRVCNVLEINQGEIKEIASHLKQKIKEISDSINIQASNLEEITHEESDALDNIPETFLSKSEYATMETNIEVLEECIDTLDSVCSQLYELIE